LKFFKREEKLKNFERKLKKEGGKGCNDELSIKDEE
jgi:hypothetical protein